MPFFLRRLAESLLLPIGISALLIIVGIAFRRRWIAAIGLLALYAFSAPALSRLMLESLERVYQPMTIAAAPTADAIVVLSGGVVRGITLPGVQWGDSADRYFTGFDLAMAGKAKKIVFTAGAADDPQGPTQGAILRQVAIDHGIPPDRIILTRRVLTTQDEARAISQMPDIHSVLLVTSAFHMPRAVLLFRAQGFAVAPFPTDERVLGARTLTPFAFIPESSGLRNSEEAMKEYYGLAVYRILYFSKPLGPLLP